MSAPEDKGECPKCGSHAEGYYWDLRAHCTNPECGWIGPNPADRP